MTTGANVSMGSVTGGSRENWTNGIGTVYLTTDSRTYRGDIALIRMNEGNSSWARIYRDNPGSSVYNTVKEKWHRTAAVGDTYCVGGATDGENCGWSVTKVRADQYYSVTDETVRNIVIGRKTFDFRTELGDSGGPVFTERPDGYIAAKGIHSGHGGGRESDHACTAVLYPCFEYFTDIWTVDAAFPGTLKIG